MRKRNYIKRIALTVISLIALAIAAIYIWSTAILDKTYHVPLTEVHIPTDSASIIEGARLTQIEHCSDCHGDHLTGAVFAKRDHVAEFVAPDITKIIPTYSNEELERLLRYGVEKNGHSVYIMPADMYHQLKEESLVKIIAYLRTLHPLPPTQGIPLRTSYDFLGRLKLIEDKIRPIASLIKPNSPRLYIPHDTTQASFGKYLVMTTCTVCHGKDLKGEEGVTPDLIIAAAYKKEEFFKLIRTGVALGDRKNIGMMSYVAKNYLSYLSDKEINSIYAYLKTKPTTEPHQIAKK
ncbi:MAG TPA: c-type cytochrome [Hanamia sp.]|nr:c-type cytochrome [Hanamia sp.]